MPIKVYIAKKFTMPTIATIAEHFCRVCNHNLWEHLYAQKGDDEHPFITDNLEYLRWKYESKKAIQSPLR